jgi:CRP-like cAMP-binding protein
MVPEILQSLSPALREKVLAACVRLSFGPGKTVIEENSLDQDLYFLQQGQLLVRALSENGVEVAFRVMEAGDCFGEFAAVDGLPRSASVETITQAILARLPRERFLGLMRSEPDFAMAMAQMITKRARAMSAQLYEMATLKLGDGLLFCRALFRVRRLSTQRRPIRPWRHGWRQPGNPFHANCLGWRMQASSFAVGSGLLSRILLA